MSKQKHQVSHVTAKDDAQPVSTTPTPVVRKAILTEAQVAEQEMERRCRLADEEELKRRGQ